MRLAMAGDVRAFGRLVRTYQTPLVRFAARMLDDPDAAQDVVQEAFVRLWRGRADYRAEGRLRFYLIRIVRNACLDSLRAAKCERAVEALQTAGFTARPNVECEAEVASFAEEVRRVVGLLPLEQRTVFILSQYEELTYAEIADLLGCPIGTVASRKHQAVHTLRRRLRGWLEDNHEV